jgi:XTP/dITP diphosphohydrolase
VKKILLATSNPGKLREVKNILPEFDFVMVSDAGVTMPEETGATFEENAILKSEAGFAQSGLPTLAEDSGLVVDALGGKPGIYSARYAGNDEENLQKVLLEMKGIANRQTRFVCVASFTDESGTHTFTGELEGCIAFEKKGNDGFGYDPIFLFDGVRTTAEISADEKSAISHRGKAIRLFQAWLATRAI